MKFFVPFFFCVLFFSSAGQSQSRAISPQKITELAKDPAWLAMLHYDRTIWGGYKGESLPGMFYFSPTGRTDPEAELKSTLQAFESNEPKIGKIQEDPRCAFPARFLFLKEKLQLSQTLNECEQLNQWKLRLDTKSVSLIFAAAYSSSAGSMFGHTFLRLNSNDQGLLGYAANYSADAGGAGPLRYVVDGIFGGFLGIFTMDPYFTKVFEYRDNEDRDLWEYEINFTPAEVDLFLNHLWEIGHAQIKYYFFDRNCSFEAIRLLDVAKPEWNLKERMPVWIVPGETVRVFAATPNALRKVDFRPSLMRLLRQKLPVLTSEEKARAQDLKDHLKPVTKEDSAWALDFALDWKNVDMYRRRKELTEEEELWKRRLLYQRAKLELDNRALAPLSTYTRPDQGHGSSKVNVYFGQNNLQKFDGLSMRLSYHDLLDTDPGYIPFSQLEIAKIDVRSTAADRWNLEKITVAELVTLVPVSAVDHRLSWGIDFGWQTPKDSLCVDCHVLHFAGGGGYSVYLDKQESWLAYIFLRATAEHGAWLKEQYRLGPSLRTGAFWKWDEKTKMSWTAERFYFPNQELAKDQQFTAGEFAVSRAFQWGKNDFEWRGTANVIHLERWITENQMFLSYYF